MQAIGNPAGQVARSFDKNQRVRKKHGQFQALYFLRLEGGLYDPGYMSTIETLCRGNSGVRGGRHGCVRGKVKVRLKNEGICLFVSELAANIS